ncbi:heparinase [Pseudoclavibacter sp. AY1F1]|uniref:heparinase II/III domain-containing protein n=1 Tax=Pseudoclavibacter sp. AY1F1 TaxID=2080583 RepID=UPI000CE77934|nr:heparinase II/III family protein [Pseudoclavibacter sp. AY1F1]PPF43637.1 heparinase [Pseudoclavibacter sp. AY1F1]
MTDTTDISVQSGTAFRGPLARALDEQLGARSLDQVIADPAHALPVPPASAWPTELPDTRTLAEMTERATAERGTPWPQPRASDAARYHGDGDRIAWETPAFARQERLTRTAVAAAGAVSASPVAADAGPGPGPSTFGADAPESQLADTIGSATLLADVVDGVILLCEQSSWCWPAHDDTLARHNSVLATVADPYLDLGAGAVVGQLAWIDQLLGDQLDAHYPGVRARIRHEARVRVFEPFTRRRDWHWLGLDGDAHNWNPWIHGNVLVAALRLLDNPSEAEERARILTLVVEGLDRYVAVLPEDGAIDEGYAYWWNGACRLLEALDLLTFATGGTFDPVPSIRSLRETIAFPHRMHLGGGWFVNAADGQAKPSADQPWHSLHRAAVRAGDDDAKRFAAAHRRPSEAAVVEAEGLGRVLRGMTDVSWLQATESAPPAPAATWLPSTQMLVAREREGSSSGVSVAVKGGHNNEHHNHNDVGNFLVASDGVPVIVDAGRPSYDARTFSDRRYELWPMQSEWHNVPFVEGRGQPTGREYAASLIEVSTGETPMLGLELVGAYDVAGLESWRREVRLDRERREVRIHDAWRWAGADAVVPVSASPSTASPSTASLPTASVTELWPSEVPEELNSTSPQLSAVEADAVVPASASPSTASLTELWPSEVPEELNSTSPQLSAVDAEAVDATFSFAAPTPATVVHDQAAPHRANFGDKTARSVQLRLLIAGKVTEVESGLVVTPLQGAPRIHITWDASAPATLTPIKLDDPMLADVWGPRLVRLDLDVADRSTMTITVRQENSILPFGDTKPVGVTA